MLKIIDSIKKNKITADAVTLQKTHEACDLFLECLVYDNHEAFEKFFDILEFNKGNIKTVCNCKNINFHKSLLKRYPKETISFLQDVFIDCNEPDPFYKELHDYLLENYSDKLPRDFFCFYYVTTRDERIFNTKKTHLAKKLNETFKAADIYEYSIYRGYSAAITHFETIYYSEYAKELAPPSLKSYFK